VKADAKPLNFITVEGIIRIPFFQRSYVWDQTNWEELFEDLNSDKNHFLGSIIFKQQSIQTGNPKEVLLIDGQQRLTTISLLLKAIYDIFDDQIKKNVFNSISNYIYFKKSAASEEYEVKIKHSRNDRDHYDLVMNDNSHNISAVDNESKLINCYKYFYDKLSELNQGGVEILLNKIIDLNYKMFVVIDLENDDDEQEIFDTINSSGVRLSSADIIKNAIFQKAINIATDANQSKVIKLYKEYWAETFQKNKQIEDSWLEQRTTGRIKRDNIEILFHSFAVIKAYYDPETRKLSELSSIYKQLIKNYENIEDIKQLLEDISEYAQIFYEHIIPEVDTFSYADPIQRVVHTIDILDVSTFYPLVLYIIKEYKNKKEMEYYLKAIETYIVRRAIANKTTKNYNKEIKDFISSIDSLVSKAKDDTSDREVKEGLRSLANKKAALLLFWIELHRRYEDTKYSQTQKELKYEYTLEHVMPKKWKDKWSNIPVYNDANEIVDDETEKERVRDEVVKYVGNMTLLTSRLNTAISNSDIGKKLNGDGRKKGMKHYSDLEITREIIEKAENNTWDEREIRNRTELLYNEIIEIWSMS
jgi:uncharacterized protein with ParB-like and HNH nuclease domain